MIGAFNVHTSQFYHDCLSRDSVLPDMSVAANATQSTVVDSVSSSGINAGYSMARNVV